MIIGHNVGVAWMYNVSYSLALVAVSAASVLWISPAAAGSGVPEVMAYLNGCHIPKARPQHCPTGDCLVWSMRASTQVRTANETRRVPGLRCSSGKRPPSSSSPAPAASAPVCRSALRCAL